eukprot:TRINITY_DN41786_c0_g1_i1.p1 TRINITY_DN41786_c0_g1~~TRINITY_DN41786_c0_g1_i1.p1  ORF type:complete len:699 (-),score=159.02 TRINITY_DN41786_c0_g1_i1:46-2094(-)
MEHKPSASELLSLTLSAPWARSAKDIEVLVAAEGLQVSPADDKRQSDGGSRGKQASRLLAGPGEYELLAPLEGLHVAVAGYELAVASSCREGEGEARGCLAGASEAFEVSLRYLKKSGRLRASFALHRVEDGRHAASSSGRKLEEEEPLDVLLPLAAPDGHLQLRAWPFLEGQRRAIGGRVWPSALLASGWLRKRSMKQPPLKGQRAFEIGAGTGTCGLVAAAHGADHVLLTDGDARVLPLLRKNVDDFVRRREASGRPCSDIKVAKLDISSRSAVDEFVAEHGGAFDIVICSDVVYDYSILEPLLEACAALLGDGDHAALLFALELRPCGVDLEKATPETARKCGLDLKDCTQELRMWSLQPPAALRVPPIAKHHRVYVGRKLDAAREQQGSFGRSTSAAGEPKRALSQPSKRPWEKPFAAGAAVGAADDAVAQWYTRSQAFWDKKEASLLGVMDGRPETSEVDLMASAAFLEAAFTPLGMQKPLLPPSASCATALGHELVALDCGAGIGRVAEGLLSRYFHKVDLLEPSAGLLGKARQVYAETSWARHFVEAVLQDLPLLPGAPYDLIWIQWVLLYLTDIDLIAFLRHAKAALSPGSTCGAAACGRVPGRIVVKENVMLNRSSGYVDERDASLTRSDARLRELFEAAGLRIAATQQQEDWPANLLPVMMYALELPPAAAV